VELIHALVAAGVAVGAAEPLHRMTPLHFAARKGRAFITTSSNAR